MAIRLYRAGAELCRAAFAAVRHRPLISIANVTSGSLMREMGRALKQALDHVYIQKVVKRKQTHDRAFPSIQWQLT